MSYDNFVVFFFCFFARQLQLLCRIYYDKKTRKCKIHNADLFVEGINEQTRECIIKTGSKGYLKISRSIPITIKPSGPKKRIFDNDEFVADDVHFYGEYNFILEKPKFDNNKILLCQNRCYFDNVPKDIWEYYIGGYQPLQKWAKDHKGIVMSKERVP